MIPIVTNKQMRLIDEIAINGDFMKSFVYMQRAGEGLMNAFELLDITTTDNIAIFCGKGNNGGDGYVFGRMLFNKGYHVVCYTLTSVDDFSKEAAFAYNEFCDCGGTVIPIENEEDISDISHFSLIIDALLGIGLSGAPREIYAKVINEINESDSLVMSVDIPSGLNADTGVAYEPTINADITVTMGFPKLGLLFFPGRDYCGNLQIHSLGYPADITDSMDISIMLPQVSDLEDLLPSRIQHGSKYDHGLVLLVSGSRGMSGSTVLAASAALRSGCGIVHAVVPHSILPVVASHLIEPILYGIAETNYGSSALTGGKQILEIVSKMDAACIGPGLSHHEETCSLVHELITEIKIPTLLDADGLNAFKENIALLKDKKCAMIITPHEREWERLFGKLSLEPLERIKEIATIAKEYSLTVVLKGNPTIVVGRQGQVSILPVGNSSLAKAGSGDVLSGIIVSLMAQKCNPLEAAVLGVALHGAAGEFAGDELSEYSVTAHDIVQYLPETFLMIADDSPKGFLTLRRQKKAKGTDARE